jgi:hypothetical protein
VQPISISLLNLQVANVTTNAHLVLYWKKWKVCYASSLSIDACGVHESIFEKDEAFKTFKFVPT